MSGKSPIEPHEAIGKAVRKHRKAANMTQENLGFEAGVQRNFVSLIETGQSQPTINTIFKLASALGIKPSKLVGDAEKLMD